MWLFGQKMWPFLGLVSTLIVPLVGQPFGWDNATQTFASSPCSSPIGSMDSVVVVESKSGDRLDFTTIQVRIWILAFSINFCLFKIEQSGNTVWQVSFHFHFWHFPSIFVQLKVTCLVTLFDRKLNSQFWMRLFLWFLNTVQSSTTCQANKLLVWKKRKKFDDWRISCLGKF